MSCSERLSWSRPMLDTAPGRAAGTWSDTLKATTPRGERETWEGGTDSSELAARPVESVPEVTPSGDPLLAVDLGRTAAHRGRSRSWCDHRRADDRRRRLSAGTASSPSAVTPPVSAAAARRPVTILRPVHRRPALRSGSHGGGRARHLLRRGKVHRIAIRRCSASRPLAIGSARRDGRSTGRSRRRGRGRCVLWSSSSCALAQVMRIEEPLASMVVDVGTGTTEIGVLALGGLVQPDLRLRSTRDPTRQSGDCAYTRLRARHGPAATAEEHQVHDRQRLGWRRTTRSRLRGHDVSTGIVRSIVIDAYGSGRTRSPPRVERILARPGSASPRRRRISPMTF